LGAKFQKTGHVTLTTPILRVLVIHIMGGHSLQACVQNVTTLASVVPEILWLVLTKI